ncbi:MAG: hypothetical protein V3U71_09130 [Cocleimonas sp.]
MAKYLQQVEISPSTHYGHSNEQKLTAETRCILFALNINFKRNVYSKFGKVVIHLWPKEFLTKKIHPIPVYEYDSMSNVAIVNVGFSIEKYVSCKKISDRNMVIYKILKKVFADLPAEFGLDGCIVNTHLEDIRKLDFIYTKISSRKTWSRSKKISARLKYVFDSLGKHLYVLIGTKGDLTEREILFRDYSTYEYNNIINVPAKLVFINDQSLKFQPKDNFYETVIIDLT